MTPDSWSLGTTGNATDEFKAIMRRAVAAGQHHSILAAVAEIRAALVRDLREFGEPLRHFRAMHMTVRSAAVRPLWERHFRLLFE